MGILGKFYLSYCGGQSQTPYKVLLAVWPSNPSPTAEWDFIRCESSTSSPEVLPDAESPALTVFITSTSGEVRYPLLPSGLISSDKNPRWFILPLGLFLFQLRSVVALLFRLVLNYETETLGFDFAFPWTFVYFLDRKVKSICRMEERIPLPSDRATTSYASIAEKDLQIDVAKEEQSLIQRAECRICQEEDIKKNLDVPCACSGSLKVPFLQISPSLLDEFDSCSLDFYPVLS